MALYRLALPDSTVAAGPIADLGCGTGVKPSLTEWGVFLSSAVSSIFELRRFSSLSGRAAATALVAENPSDAGLTGITLVDLAVAAPTSFSLAPASMATVVLPGTIGTGVIWTFPRGIKFVNGGDLAIYTGSSPGTTIHHVAVDI